jgi:hypothetical protein
MSKPSAAQLLSILTAALLTAGCGSSSSGNTPPSRSTPGRNATHSSGTATTVSRTARPTSSTTQRSVSTTSSSGLPTLSSIWTAGSVIPSGPSPGSAVSQFVLACASASMCVAGNTDTSLEANYNGHMWSELAADPSYGAASFAAACAPSFCMLTDLGGGYSTWNGTSWSRGEIPGNAAADNGVGTLSCVSSSFCIGVDPDNQYYVWNGEAWSTGGSMPDTAIASDLSCAATTFCVEADRGQLVMWNGTSWTNGPSEADSQDSYLVSCSSKDFCVVAITSSPSRVIYWNGASWSRPAIFTAATSGFSINSLACPSTSDCTAGSETQLYTYSRNGWARGPSVPSGFDTLSCPTTAFCMDVKGNGQTLIGP